MSFDDLLRSKLGKMADVVSMRGRPMDPPVDPSKLFFRRALAVEARVRTDISWDVVELYPRHQAQDPVRLTWKQAAPLLQLHEFEPAASIQARYGVPPTTLMEWVAKDLLYYSRTPSPRSLSGSGNVLLHADPAQKIARRRSVWMTPALEGPKSIAPMPFMPRGDELTLSRLCGFRFASLERDHEVFGVALRRR